jgi:hypothetical protein
VAATAEDAIRNYPYLLHLNGATVPFEDERVAELRQRLEASADPIERVQLHAELAHASDPARLEEAFVTHAKTWADDKGVTAKAFEQEGVSRDVLRRAGLDGRCRRVPGPVPRRPAVGAGHNPREPSRAGRTPRGRRGGGKDSWRHQSR